MQLLAVANAVNKIMKTRRDALICECKTPQYDSSLKGKALASTGQTHDLLSQHEMCVIHALFALSMRQPASASKPEHAAVIPWLGICITHPRQMAHDSCLPNLGCTTQESCPSRLFSHKHTQVRIIKWQGVWGGMGIEPGSVSRWGPRKLQTIVADLTTDNARIGGHHLALGQL